jgi:hypothetical protein
MQRGQSLAVPDPPKGSHVGSNFKKLKIIEKKMRNKEK